MISIYRNGTQRLSFKIKISDKIVKIRGENDRYSSADGFKINPLGMELQRSRGEIGEICFLANQYKFKRNAFKSGKIDIKWVQIFKGIIKQ